MMVIFYFYCIMSINLVKKYIIINPGVGQKDIPKEKTVADSNFTQLNNIPRNL